MIKKLLSIAGGIGVLAVGIIVVVVMSYDYNKFKEPVARAVEQATGRRLTLGGDIALSLGLTPALVLEDVDLANAAWGSRPNMVQLKRFEVQVALLPLIGGSVEVQRFILIEPDILIETDAKGRSNLAFEAPGKTAGAPAQPPPRRTEPAGLPAMALDSLEIRHGRLTYRDGASGKTHQVLLRQVRAGMTGLTSPLTFSVQGDYNGEAFGLKGELGPLAAAADPTVSWPVNLRAEALDINMTLDGTLKDLAARKGMNLGFDVKAPGLARAAALMGHKLPADFPIHLAGRLQDAGPKSYRIADFTLTFDRSDLGGDLAFDLSAQRPRLTAELTSRRIDARTLLKTESPATAANRSDAPPAAVKKPKTAKAPDTRVFADDPLPLDGLDALDARVALRVDQLLLPKIAVDKLDATVNLEDGRLTVTPLKAQIGGGTLDADLRLDRQGKAADLSSRLRLDRLDVGRMLKELEITDMFEGRFDADIDLKGKGVSVAALMAGLDGHARVVMEKGRIGKSLMNVLGGDTVVGLLNLIHPASGSEAYTDINCCVVRFDVRRGIAETTALVLDTEQVTLVGAGKVDLRTEAIDLALKPTPKQGLSAGKFGKLSMSLGELAKPFKLTGTLAQPSLAIDPTQTALALGKAIGGAALFGPLGIAAALASGDVGSDENPCAAALEAAKAGNKAPAAPAARPTVPAADDPVQQVGNTIKNLFGN